MSAEQFADLSELIHAAQGVEIVAAPPDLPRAALWYAHRWGWQVFPCKPRTKVPLTDHGFEDASADLEQVKAWWARWPDANIAAPTGPAECGGIGFDVIDLDGDKGITTFADLPPHRIPTPRAIAFTPGDPSKDKGPGRHHYIAATGDGNGNGVMAGVDYRGALGYVMLPPSLGPHGVTYAWITKPEGKA